MELINKDFQRLSKEEFEQTTEGLNTLALIVVPLLLKENIDGKGFQAAAELSHDLQIAADAVKEVKEQIFGRDEREAEEDA